MDWRPNSMIQQQNYPKDQPSKNSWQLIEELEEELSLAFRCCHLTSSIGFVRNAKDILSQLKSTLIQEKRVIE